MEKGVGEQAAKKGLLGDATRFLSGAVGWARLSFWGLPSMVHNATYLLKET